jgi:hypothetical protein
MRSLLALVLVAVLFCACSDVKTLGGKTYDTYGLINKDDVQNSNVRYEPCWGNIVWGAILFETVIAPIYFFGFDMMEPIDLKAPDAEPGVVPQ